MHFLLHVIKLQDFIYLMRKSKFSVLINAVSSKFESLSINWSPLCNEEKCSLKKETSEYLKI